MSDERLAFLSIAELSPLIRSREISPVEVVDTQLARIERLNPRLGAFVTVAATEARAAARAAEAEIARGGWRGPLHGIPVGVKDIFDTAGIRTTHGSSFYRDHFPAEDAESIRRLKAAGAIVVGKCNTHEFAAGSTTNNPWYGPTRNRGTSRARRAAPAAAPAPPSPLFCARPPPAPTPAAPSAAPPPAAAWWGSSPPMAA